MDTPLDAERVVLNDGRSVRVRPVLGDDTAELRAMHRRLSTTTVARRFFALLRDLPQPLAERLTHVDGVDRAALVAEAPSGQIVGVVRYDRLPPGDRAEVAIVVEDGYQKDGLGTELLRRLVDLSVRQGVRELTADVQNDNLAVHRTLRDVGLEIIERQIDHGVTHFVMRCTPAAATSSLVRDAGSLQPVGEAL